MCFGFDKFYFPDRVIALGDLFQTNRLIWAWGVAEHWGNSILFWNRGMNARWPNAEGAFYQVFFYYVLNNEICPFLKFSGTIATKITALALLSMFDNSHLYREAFYDITWTCLLFVNTVFTVFFFNENVLFCNEMEERKDFSLWRALAVKCELPFCIRKVILLYQHMSMHFKKVNA